MRNLSVTSFYELWSQENIWNWIVFSCTRPGSGETDQRGYNFNNIVIFQKLLSSMMLKWCLDMMMSKHLNIRRTSAVRSQQQNTEPVEKVFICSSRQFQLKIRSLPWFDSSLHCSDVDVYSKVCQDTMTSPFPTHPAAMCSAGKHCCSI